MHEGIPTIQKQKKEFFGLFDLNETGECDPNKILECLQQSECISDSWSSLITELGDLIRKGKTLTYEAFEFHTKDLILERSTERDLR